MSNASSGSGPSYYHTTSYNGNYINYGSHASNGGIIINHSNSLLGLEKITNAASPNAFYDSAANQLPSTITSNKDPVADHYTSIAMDWIRSQSSISIMWLAGESRVLTSLIAQRTAKSSSQQKSLLTTFFFSKGDSSRNSTKHFVASLAYGIIQSISVPESQDAITQAVEKDPLMFSASTEKQFDKLIWNSLNHYLYHQRADNQHSTFPHVIIVNALDECEDVPEREQILRLFERLYTSRLNGDHLLPWKVLVTSKFDQTIEKVLKTFPYSDSVSVVFLPGEHDLPKGRTRAEKSPFSLIEHPDSWMSFIDKSTVYRVRSLYDFEGEWKEDLSFTANVVITANPSNDGGDWWYGKLVTSGKSGFLPKTWVEVIDPRKARAVFSYTASKSDELSFTEGQMLDIVDTAEEGWWKAERGGKVFMVPAGYLELVEAEFVSLIHMYTDLGLCQPKPEI